MSNNIDGDSTLKLVDVLIKNKKDNISRDNESLI